MPRIDPLQLLKCLSVLLAPNGGIKSKEEVQRLASLMTKFSKKLVSKCIYIQILKTTKTDLLGMFMGAGGWNLTYTWLSDAIVAKNWPLIQELLELLLMCPVDVVRLKANNCPKLIKGLSKDGSSESVRLLATKLVEQWLRIVKGEVLDLKAHSAHLDTKPIDMGASVKETRLVQNTVTIKEEYKISDTAVKEEPQAVETVIKSRVEEESVEQESFAEVVSVKTEIVKVNKTEPVKSVDEPATSEDSGEEVAAWNGPVTTQLPVYKITIRDGKQVLAKVYTAERPIKKAGGDVSMAVATDSPKQSIGSTDKTKDSIVEDESVPCKVNSELKNSEVKVSEVKNSEVKSDVRNSEVKNSTSAKSKLKIEKHESSTSGDGMKLSKDIQKKSKDIQTISKVSDKKKTSDSVKDKSDSSKDKSKDKKDKLKEKEKENKSKEKKFVLDKAQIEKDRATLAKLIPPAISKLGKIPKKPKSEESQKPTELKSNDVKNSVSDIKKIPDVKKSPVTESRKSSISIEIRKNTDSCRPKTVKTFNSKFRSTGLEEEVKPPPSRASKKLNLAPEKKSMKPVSLKRSSPPKELSPPEKKLKPSLSDIGLMSSEETKKSEKTGSIKLIPPRPKPAFLQESDMFMDALTASTKKEPRKRKRRISSSKEDSKKELSNKEETTPPTSPTTDEMKSPPVIKPTLKFYQDTMETEDEREAEEDNKDIERKFEIDTEGEENNDDGDRKTPTPTPENDDDSKDSAEMEDKRRRLSKEESSGSSDGISSERDSEDKRYPNGVLVYHKMRKGPKKTVRWKPEKELEVIKFFELDETERVNVTKTFMDMKQMERSNEREAFLLARKLSQDDTMEEKTNWLPLIPIEMPASLVEPGKNSREKDIQYAREKVILQAIYFNRTMIPDTSSEPDMEIHATTDPVIIPLDDVTGNSDSINDFQNTPWPEPKPMIIPQSPPPQFQLPQPPQFPTFPPASQYAGPQMFPVQQPMPNNMVGPGPAPMMVSNSMNTGSGDWRTGDGKVVAMNDMPMPMDMYNQGVPMSMNNMNMSMNNMNMNMGIPHNMGPNMPPNAVPPDMNYNMMGGEEMNQGGPYPPQGFGMGGPPSLFAFRGGRPPGPNMSGSMRNRGGRGGPGGPWFRQMGGGSGNWQGGRGGRGGWGGPNRNVCKHFRGGYCRHADKCPYLHPGVNGPQF